MRRSKHNMLRLLLGETLRIMDPVLLLRYPPLNDTSSEVDGSLTVGYLLDVIVMDPVADVTGHPGLGRPNGDRDQRHDHAAVRNQRRE